VIGRGLAFLGDLRIVLEQRAVYASPDTFAEDSPACGDLEERRRKQYVVELVVGSAVLVCPGPLFVRIAVIEVGVAPDFLQVRLSEQRCEQGLFVIAVHKGPYDQIIDEFNRGPHIDFGWMSFLQTYGGLGTTTHNPCTCEPGLWAPICYCNFF
jgi:hypothetical protein